ncbi:MAG: hypothetical protein DHS20C21_22530 [Gemmatimonadota bacterium]|nr:MAG: hypothetical protein DHS20C21_22530 [Gemmatimonadota bacterium]
MGSLARGAAAVALAVSLPLTVAHGQSEEETAALLMEIDALSAMFQTYTDFPWLEDGEDASFVYGDTKGIVHHYVSEGGRLRERWKSFPLEGLAKEVFAEDLDGDGRPEIIAYTQKSRIYIWETQKYELLWESVDISERIKVIQAMVVADADRDPQLELIVCGDNKIHYIDGVDYYVEKAGRDFVEPSMMLVADVDNDLELEIITNDGYVIDTNTLNIEWANDGFGYPITLFDLDNDGVLEVVGESQGALTFWDVEERREIW